MLTCKLYKDETDTMHLFSVQVQFLRDIGVQDDAIGNVLVKFPHLLTYSLYKKIRPVVRSFLFRHASCSVCRSLLVYVLFHFFNTLKTERTSTGDILVDKSWSNPKGHWKGDCFRA